MLKPHIVILGAGFGGTSVAKRLVPYVKKGAVDVTIINRTNYFLFTPLLHEVATGSLSPANVAEPLREIFVNTGVRVVQGIIENIDRTQKSVKLSGINGATIQYDYLVISTGAETAYYDIPGAEKFTYPLKDLSDAARIRSRIIDSFEQAILTKDSVERARLLSFIVVGGGATGVETVAELADFVHGMVKRYFRYTDDCLKGDSHVCKPEEAFVSLIHTGPHVLSTFAPSLSSAAEDQLTMESVALQLNSRVVEVTQQGVKLSSGIIIPSATIIWSAGVKPIIPHFTGVMPALVEGRLAVDQYFRVNGDEHIFALGDTAGYVDKNSLSHDPTKPKPLPMLAQVAVAQARNVADNIIASIRGDKLSDFTYISKGSMVSVGQWFAIGHIFSINISGRLTWWLWRTVYLFKFTSWRKRLRIAFEWTFDLVYPRDITKLN